MFQKDEEKQIQVSCIQLHWAQKLETNLEKCMFYIDRAAAEGSQVVLFPEANITSYFFPYVVGLADSQIQQALADVAFAAFEKKIWVIAGSIQKRKGRYLNLAHVINPEGKIIHEYAKINMAGEDEKACCSGGNQLSLFDIDGTLCTLVICRDGRHPELYRIPAMAGAQILFHPSCSSDDVEAVNWKRISGRAQQPVGPNSKIFHCVANTVGQSPDGKKISSGDSFIRDPNGLPLAEAGFYQEEMITAVLDLSLADRSYIKDSLENPPCLKEYWELMIKDVESRCFLKPEDLLD